MAATHVRHYSSSDDESEILYPATAYQGSVPNEERYYADSSSDTPEGERLALQAAVVEINPRNEPTVKNAFRRTPGLLLLGFFGASVAVILGLWVVLFSDGLDVGAFLWLSSSIDPHTAFAWHPVFMIFGVVLLFTSGQIIRTMRSATNLPWGRGDQCLGFLNSVCNIAGILSLLGGMWAIHIYHSAQGHRRLYSLHSWFGVATEGSIFLWLFWSWAGKRWKASVDFVGTLAVALAMTTALCGILDAAICRLQTHGKHDYSGFSSEGIVLNLLGCSIAAYGSAYVYFQVKNVTSAVLPKNFTSSEKQKIPLKRIQSSKDHEGLPPTMLSSDPTYTQLLSPPSDDRLSSQLYLSADEQSN